MAFVIEPGIYIRPERSSSWPTRPKTSPSGEVGPALKKYAGIGVRIEDSFLLTGKELVRLSARVPRTLQEIDDFGVQPQRRTRMSSSILS